MDDPHGPAGYEIDLGASLSEDWSAWFDGFRVDPARPTRLLGRAVDQAALHGVLARLRDLGIPLVALRRVGDVGGVVGGIVGDDRDRNTPAGT